MFLKFENSPGEQADDPLILVQSESLKNALPNCARIIDKLATAIKNSSLYEAHQLYKTLYFRCTMQQQFEPLSELLYQGTIYLLKSTEYNSAQDLTSLYLETVGKLLQANRCTQSEEHSNLRTVRDHRAVNTIDYQISTKISRLLFLLPRYNDSSKTDTERHKRLTTETFKSIPTTCINHGLLHYSFAMVHWGACNYADSRYHFLHSFPIECAHDCAAMLIELHLSRGYPSEVDLFIAHFVLQILCIPDKKHPRYPQASTASGAATSSRIRNCQTFAHEVFTCYTQAHPSIRQPSPFSLPLLNFAWFLLSIIDSNETTTFKKLCDVYSASLRRDPVYHDYLVKIGSVYFGMETRQSRPGSMFSSLLQTFIDDGANEDRGTDPFQGGPAPKSKRQDQELKIQEDELD